MSGADAPGFRDHFSERAGEYARFRPRYPAGLFRWLAGVAPAREAAWDCATGNGQAALGLAEHFARVVATDASPQQLAEAAPHPRVEYRRAPAERSGLPAAAFDLVCVAQAVHWFDVEAFFAEAARVLRPGGVLAVWGYGNPSLEPGALDERLQRFTTGTLAPHWPPERALVVGGYRSLPFPFPELPPPALELRVQTTLHGLAGYLGTWSAVRRFREARGTDPVAALRDELLPLWGDPERARPVRWPLFLRAGRRP